MGVQNSQKIKTYSIKRPFIDDCPLRFSCPPSSRYLIERILKKNVKSYHRKNHIHKQIRSVFCTTNNLHYCAKFSFPNYAITTVLLFCVATYCYIAFFFYFEK